MPLKIRIKPEQKFFAGGAVMKNVGKKPADILVLSDSPVLRDDYLMNIDRKEESDAASIYFLLQVIYLFQGKGQPIDQLVIETVRKFGNLYPHLQGQVATMIAHLEAGEGFKALRLGHALLADQQASGPKGEDGIRVALT